MTQEISAIARVLRDEPEAIVQSWLRELGGSPTQQHASASAEAQAIVAGLGRALEGGADQDSLDTPGWRELRGTLEALSASRAAKGDTAGATSRFVLALKKPLFDRLQKDLAAEPARLASAVWTLSTLVDRLAQHTADTFQESREQVIRRQQDDLLELSTPVVKLWHGVLAVPMIGTLDSNRTQHVMEALLQSIVDTGAELAIIDITGVPTVDTLVAQHLLKTVTAIRLMGADCIISGIRPQIAQTIVHLGIDLQGISTKASLADALAQALRQTGWRISRQD
ncbi:STAS domain-containing protein [Xenophilus arseniciresistens]|uniref:STAS domain-containing protein n=1 Tax=Xenophilus arseniciresistens TaxID=1283306 RepID=A0AAE3NB49_9BURK|nr:STAS domain-containing protein [Xenophilus arseniciresistens]MDA7416414.1 STAS domain-containing protein [Xenophilus arseniciresistens]